MRMLYPLGLIWEQPIAISPPADAEPPVQQLLALARTVSLLFDRSPTVLPPVGTTLTLLYRDVVYLLQAVVDSAGESAAALSALWPLRFYGTTEGRETAQWDIFALNQKTALVRLRSVSGKSFDHLEGLAIQLDLPDAALAAALEKLCAAAPFLRACAVIPAEGAALLRGSKLAVPDRGSRFCYLSWEPLSSGQLLCALTAEHKVTLWKDFLANGVQAVEFDRLWAQYYTGEPLLLLEWTLALYSALEELDFRVERGTRTFRVLDGEGRERHFDFVRGGPAEKVFLKLLFPLDAK